MDTFFTGKFSVNYIKYHDIATKYYDVTVSNITLATTIFLSSWRKYKRSDRNIEEGNVF